MSTTDITKNQEPTEQQLIEMVKLHLETLPDEGRIEFIDKCMEDYCELCGTSYLPCYCSPVYDI
jgi:hypothetical protein